MLKKINNGNIKRSKNNFFKNQKSHIDFFYFFKSNAKSGVGLPGGPRPAKRPSGQPEPYYSWPGVHVVYGYTLHSTHR